MNSVFVKYKVYLIAIVCLAAVAGAARYFLWPEWITYQMGEKKLEEKTADLVKAQNVAEMLRESQDQIVFLQDQLNAVKKLVPDSNAEADLLVQLEAVARETGVQTGGYVFNLEQKKSTKGVIASKDQSSGSETGKSFGALKTLEIPVTVTGTYQAIKAYMERLLTIDRLITIRTITIGSAENGVEAKIDLVAYKQ